MRNLNTEVTEASKLLSETIKAACQAIDVRIELRNEMIESSKKRREAFRAWAEEVERERAELYLPWENNDA